MPWRIEAALLSTVSANVRRVKQVHGNTIVWAEDITPETAADGIVARTGFPDPFLIRTADCLPLVLTTPDTACALHVSRKSLVAGLLEQVPNYLNLAEIDTVYIGPHVCEEHFIFEKIGPEIEAFRQKFPFACRQSTAGLHVSLKKVVEEYLKQWGVKKGMVSFDTRCTFEAAELPSYRRSLRDKQPLTDHITTIVAPA